MSETARSATNTRAFIVLKLLDAAGKHNAWIALTTLLYRFRPPPEYYVLGYPIDFSLTNMRTTAASEHFPDVVRCPT